ncbi:MAG TPA: hypothetical protein VK438_16010 [Xanthobacteraceae bacterium]|nr:hypothetical protein [Xanthobacteraceae bacterium]
MSHLVFDSVTVLPPQARGRAALAASHGGVYAAYCAAKAGIKGVLLCDAGVGRERAGIGGLDYLDRLGVAAAAIGHRSARIGDGADCFARGVISFVNLCAAQAGVTPGMSARTALDRLERMDAPPSPAPATMHETRHEISAANGVRVFTLDSNALVAPEDAGHIMLTGSHGGLLGGRAATAVKYDVFAAVYNDAGFGIEDAGIARLPALQARGIAGACVSAWSARIGDGQSTYRDGFVSAINVRAAACGGEIGMAATALIERLVAARLKELK